MSIPYEEALLTKTTLSPSLSLSLPLSLSLSLSMYIWKILSFFKGEEERIKKISSAPSNTIVVKMLIISGQKLAMEVLIVLMYQNFMASDKQA